MTTYRVHLFQRFEVTRDGMPVAVDVRKAQELLCYLLLFRHQPQPREVLAERLWGEDAGLQGRRTLRKTLWQLQGLLQPAADADAHHLIWAEDEWVQLHPQARLWTDTALLDAAYRSAHGTPGHALTAAQATAAEQAVDHYRGDLLEGWYHGWCLVEREHYRFMALTLLDKLCGYWEANQAYDAAIGYGLRLLRHEPARESAHRRLMRLHALAGDRTAALRQYDWCVTALREDLDVEPDEQTTRLYAQLQAGRMPQAGPALESPTQAADDLAALLRRLEQMQGVVGALQQQLANEMSSLRAYMAATNARS